MKLTINGYEIVITARGKSSEHFNNEDVERILDQVSIWAFEAGRRYYDLKLPALERKARSAEHAIFEYLERRGYYD